MHLTHIILTFIALFAVVPSYAFAQNATALPVATTVSIADAKTEGSEVVVYDEATDAYLVSTFENDSRVYGVTALSPALVFVTGSGTIPVVTIGAAAVSVTASNGDIQRGDILTTSPERGAAMKADLSHDNVFAIALEDFSGVSGTIAAEVNVEGARTLQEARRAIEAQESGEGGAGGAEGILGISYARAAVAATIAIGSLFFLLYSFRSAMAKGVVSIGRNPRARTSILTLAFGNIFFALILCAVGLFVSIAVLILPI